MEEARRRQLMSSTTSPRRTAQRVGNPLQVANAAAFNLCQAYGHGGRRALTTATPDHLPLSPRYRKGGGRVLKSDLSCGNKSCW